MPKQTKAIQEFKVINYDANGKLIPDLSKVILPPDLNRLIFDLKIQDYKEKHKLN
ncbi:hypothetical protein [Melissococcus plutonius]|uniref:hypothetical protein n=1 Tax=Melissococcus plutonius TaxID=33970 RepID=UPI0021E59B0D|nr:hypothetical protein [Melissococcus plutonius]MCV2499640.1 hypothetical protein [Melissococcus plutonius]MCV2506034.1 hypothetical protein [Melissococcus plutonius]MCV2508249.1 hypothetical protein [Melissococcus plutonius]MCV2526970.1 hypothetical protein [Melissococcus plutonius]